MSATFIKIPNCPEKKVTLAALGNYEKIIRSLKERQIGTVSFKNPDLDKEVSRHADMLMCHLGENKIFLDPKQQKEELENNGFQVFFSDKLEKFYPNDTKLNTAVSDRFFVCNPKSIDENLRKTLLSENKKEIATKQGYAKCSVCFVAENAVITEDENIAKVLRGNFIDVLLIQKGDVYLSDIHIGFFGGATGKISKNILAVTGELKYHRDAEKIYNFCKTYNVTIDELTKGKIIDIGGILPLKEN